MACASPYPCGVGTATGARRSKSFRVGAAGAPGSVAHRRATILAAHQVPYRLVGGKDYFARDEVRALTSVLRAVDNPADRLATFAALRSPFFGFSDDDLWQFVSSGATNSSVSGASMVRSSSMILRSILSWTFPSDR